MIFEFTTEKEARVFHSNVQHYKLGTRSKRSEDNMSVEVETTNIEPVKTLARRCGWKEQTLDRVR